MGFLARHLDQPALHSHLTGILPGVRRTGLGRAMKLHQRAWAAERRPRLDHVDVRPARASQRLVQPRGAQRSGQRLPGELLWPDERLHQHRRRVPTASVIAWPDRFQHRHRTTGANSIQPNRAPSPRPTTSWCCDAPTPWQPPSGAFTFAPNWANVCCVGRGRHRVHSRRRLRVAGSGGCRIVTGMRLVDLELRRIALDDAVPYELRHRPPPRHPARPCRVGVLAGRTQGWGECVAGTSSAYSASGSTAPSGWSPIRLRPVLVRARRRASRPPDVAPALGRSRGTAWPRRALETAVLDAELRAAGASLADPSRRHPRPRRRAASRRHPADSIDELLAQVAGLPRRRLRRIKLKVEPGWDLEPVAAVREPSAPTCRCRSTPTPRTTPTTSPIWAARRLRPAADRAALSRTTSSATPTRRRRSPRRCASTSPSCRSTRPPTPSISAPADVVNIKPGRVGGYLEAAADPRPVPRRGVPVWCGGMLETGVGRAANAGPRRAPRLHAARRHRRSTRFYARDIVIGPSLVVDGHVDPYPPRGIGVELDHRLSSTSVTARRSDVDLR